MNMNEQLPHINATESNPSSSGREQVIAVAFAAFIAGAVIGGVAVYAFSASSPARPLEAPPKPAASIENSPYAPSPFEAPPEPAASIENSPYAPLPSVLDAQGIDNVGRKLTVNEVDFAGSDGEEAQNIYTAEGLGPDFKAIKNAMIYTIDRATRYDIEAPEGIAAYFLVNGEGVSPAKGKDVVAIKLTAENLSSYGQRLKDTVRLIIGGKSFAPFKVQPSNQTVESVSTSAVTYLFEIGENVYTMRFIFGSSFEDPDKIVDIDFFKRSVSLVK